MAIAVARDGERACGDRTRSAHLVHESMCYHNSYPSHVEEVVGFLVSFLAHYKKLRTMLPSDVERGTGSGGG